MSRQRPKPYIFYHGNCPDGFGAAYIAWLVFKDQAHYVPLTYGDPLPELKPRADLYFVDFSLPRQQLLDLNAEDRLIVVLDHHVTAMVDLGGIEVEARGNNSPIVTEFSQDKSGIGISWEYWFGDAKPLPRVLAHLQDRDLWTNAIEGTEEIYQAMESYEKSFDIWHDLITRTSAYDRLRLIGGALVRQQQERIKVLIREPRFATILDTEIGFPAVNAPYFMSSDLGNKLLEQYPTAPFAATYRDLGDGRRGWSLRSANDRLDVGALAKSLGGGGHRNAAGFIEEISKEGHSTLVRMAWNLVYSPEYVVVVHRPQPEHMYAEKILESDDYMPYGMPREIPSDEA